MVGVGRSGTTLLRLMLDSHPQLAIPAETHFVPELIERERECDNSAELVEVIIAARTWDDFGLDPERLREAAAGAPGAAAVLRAFYGLCAEAQGKPRWGDKTPGYVKRMRPIGGALEEARFVHLIRDGRDVALSRLRRGMGEGKPIADVADLWRRRIENARRQARRLRGRYIELRFEDLVADPAPALRRVCDLVELEFDPAMLLHDERAAERIGELGDLAADGGRRERDREERQAAHALAAQPPTSARTEVWRTEMSATDRAVFDGVAGGLLAELGYDVPS
ncbi:MAG: sulfotransferase family protein [Vicinamibacteria bacterium]